MNASEETLQETLVECRGVLERHARSFSAAAVFLTPTMRDQAAIAYAFCRLVDDAVDEAQSEEHARFELGQIEAMLKSELEPTPVVAAYIDLCRRVGVGLGPARDLILGARSDLGRVRVGSDEEFFLYCYRVAGTVGQMMCGILGVRDPDAERHAVDLGTAMQITNICRDVLEDAQRDRVYLPEARLRALGLHAEDVARVGALTSPSETPPAVRLGIARVVEGLLDDAERYYESGATGLVYIPLRPRFAIAVARSLYREIGETLRRSECDPLLGRARVPRLRKLALTLRCAVSWCVSLFKEPASEPAPEPRVLAK